MTPTNNTLSAPKRQRGRPRGWDDKTEQNTIKSLDRAIEVLEYLSETPGRTLSALSGELRQSPATIYRVLITLQGRGLVEFDAEEQQWHVGPGAFVIGARFLRRTSIFERARPVLRQLMERTGETANLGIEKNGLVLFVGQVETHENIRAFFPPGTMSPMHSSGIGKALLAEMDVDRLSRILRTHKLKRFTRNTITNADELREELAAIRARGYSVDGEEKNLGMRCIAAAVFDMNREAVAGISISGPSSRMDAAKFSALSDAVMDAAAALSSAIGGERSGAGIEGLKKDHLEIREA